MSDTAERTTAQALAFQKIWLDSMSKLMQTAFTFRPDAAPPEVLREIRGGIFQALAKSWEEFMRSPQFLDGMKQWMDQAVTFRKMSNDFMASVRNELQATSREDVDTIMLTVRHMEKRLLDRIEELSGQVNDLTHRFGNGEAKQPAAKAPGRAGAPPRATTKTSRREAKPKML